MSKQVDERVVSMQFDNAQFEKNVSTTMSTLEKLKQSLNLTGAAKGFEDIGAAAKKVDMTGLSNGVENVGLKFNALYTIADQTLRNITTRAQQAAEQMVKSLTIQPISTGFNEYELKMGSIQTIMASTGESLDTVNKYLNELNKYSDQTIYSFSDMTTNIGKFTNAGVKLEDAVMAIKGISNEAAVSGANANEASRAMYNFAQALSAGYVKLIDWKSIENANMATVEFKNYLLEAAAAAGTLEKQSNGMYKVLSSNAQGGTFDQLIDSTHYFNDSLNYQWMTTEALVSTLKNYADETTEIGKKAYASAQDIKTFSQMMDTLKESAQSGWATTWELIIGDFETAKKTWTIVGQVVGDMINDMSDSRNNLLKGALTSNWDKMIEKITEAGVSSKDFEESLRDVLESHGKDVDKLIEKHGSLEQVFRKEAWGSKYLKEALAGINTELEDLSGIERTLKIGSSGEDVEKIQKALKNAGFQCGEFGKDLDGVDGKLGKVTQNAIKAFQKAHGLEADGIIGPKTLKALEEANKKTSKLEENIDDLVGVIDQLGGRELLIEGLKNIFEALKQILGAVKDAWDNVFDGFKSSDLYNIIERFHNFTETLSLNKDTTDKITNAFEGFFTILKFVRDVVIKVISVGAKLIGVVFKPLAKVVLSVASAIGDFVKSAGKTITKVFEPMGDVIDNVIEFIGKLADSIADLVSDGIDKLASFEWVQTVGEWFSDLADTVSDAVSRITSYLSNLGDGKVSAAFSKIQNGIDSITKWWASFKTSEDGMTIIEGITAPFKGLWDWITSFKLPKFDLDKTIKSLSNYFDFLKDNDYSGIAGSIVGTFAHIKSILTSKWDTLQGNALQNFSNFYLKYGDTIKDGFDACKRVFKSIIEFVFATDELSIPAILDLAKKILTVMILIKSLNIVSSISNSIASVAEAFENIGKGFNNIAKAIKWRAIGAAFLSIGGALVMFTICMKIIEGIEDPSKSMRVLLTALTVMGAIVGGLLFLGNKLDGGIDLLAATGSMLAIAISLAILVYTLKQIDGTEFKDLKSSFGILTGVLLSLMMVMAVVGKSSGSNFKTAVALAVMIGALKGVLDILDAYSEYDWDKAKDAIPKMAAVLLGLSLALRIATGGVKQGANTSGLGFLMLSMVLSLKVLVGVISEFGKMPESELKQGIAAIMIVLAGITSMLTLINMTSKATVVDKGQRAVTGFAGLAAALLAVAITIAILGSLPIDTLKQGGAAVTIVLGLFTTMLAILGKSMGGITGFGKITGMIIGMGVIIAELAIIMYLMRDLDGTDALAKFGAISLVLVAMAGCLRTLTKHQNGAKNIYKWIGAMIAFSLVVAELAFILKSIQGVDGVNAIAQFGAISIVLTVMGLTLENLTKHYRIKPENIYKWVLAMIAFGLVVAELGFIMKSLQGVDGVNAISQFGAISLLLLAMASCIKILCFIGPAASGAIPALGTLAVFATGLVAFLSVLGGIDKFFKGGFSDVMDRAVDIMTKIGQAIGGLVGGVLEGIGKGLTAALPQMGKDLSDFMDSASVFFAGLESIDASMVTNTGNMVAAITKLSALGIQNGAANVFSVGRSLPNLGTDLSAFMTNASDFFSGLSGIDTNMGGSVKAIAEAIGILAEASLLDTLTFGDGFESLGDKLVPFGEDLVAFSRTISGKIDTQAVEAAAAAAGVMAELNSKLPKEYGAIAGLFASESIPLDTFGNQLVLFGNALVSFSDTVKGKVDASAVEAAAAAGTLMAELNSKLPKEYGAIAGLFASESIPLDTFGTQLVLFGRAIVSFSNTVSKGAIDTDAVETAKNAASIMSELATNLPREHGAISGLFTSDAISLDTFGSQLVLFGRAMVSFSNTVKGGIDQGAVEAAATAGSVMNELANNLPEETSWWDRWFGSGGTMSMEDFGSQLVKFGDAIVDFSQSMSGSVDVSVVKTAVTVINDLVDLTNNLPEEMDLSVLKTCLTDLSEAMIKFSEAVSGNVDNTTITTVVNAAKTLAQAAALMPEQVDMAKLTVGLSDFGTAIVSFSDQVSGAVDGGSVTTATQAGKDIASMLTTIPKEIDPTNFIDNLGKLGTALVEFSTNVAGSDDSPGIDNTALANAQTACGYIGNMLTSLAVYTDLTDFISNAKLLAQALVDFSNTVSAEGAINSDAISTASAAGVQIGNMLTSFAVYTDITEFVSNAKKLAQAIVDFSAIVSAEGAINNQTITNATTAGNQISSLLVTIPASPDISGFVSNSASLAKAIVDFSANVAEGIDSAAISAALESANRIKNMMVTMGGVPDISGKINLIGKLGDTILDFSNTVTQADMTGLGEDSATFKKIVESFGELSESGVEAFIKNLSGAQGKTKAAIATFCGSLISTVSGYRRQFKTAGMNLVDGFAAGITANTWKAQATSAAMASAALAAAKAALGIKSPSKEFYKAGGFAGEGFINAFADYESDSSKAGSAMAKSALLGLRDAITAAKDLVENGIDAQPTIRPVLDLSGVQADASLITSLFDTSPSVGVMANVGAISRGMAYGQNGSTNDDVINAINGLKDSLSKKTGDTYSIGNISYDDGTEVSNAIKTLVRAARVERRK